MEVASSDVFEPPPMPPVLEPPSSMPPVPPPAHPPLSHHHDLEEEPSASAAASSSSRAPAATRILATPAAPRVNRTPDEISQMLCPNRDFSIVVKYNDWRLESQCRLHLAAKDSAKLYAPYSQKTFSRAFISIPWQDALMDVHDFHMAQMATLETFVASSRGDGGTSARSNPRKCLEILQAKLDPEVLAPPKYGGKLKTKAE